MEFLFSDGGAKKAGFSSSAGDCVVRAFSIATGRDYSEVRQMVLELAKEEKITKRQPKRSTPRGGVYKPTTRKLAASLGYEWIPLMKVGQGCKHRLKVGELPVTKHPIVAKVSRHVTVVEDGRRIIDTHDCSRGGTRCVYGIYVRTEDYDESLKAVVELAA